MHRTMLPALLASALLASSAVAEPLSLHADRYVNAEPRPVPAYAAQSPAQSAPAVRYASAEPDGNPGGGFMEFLFGSARPMPPPRPQADIAVPGNQYAARTDVTAEPARPAVDPKFSKQTVAYTGLEAPGTIIIDTPERFLYLVQNNGTALRYGIGVGRPGFTWAGSKKVTAKKEWPDWTPPLDMLERRPDLPKWMAGGPENPMGARALYLGSSLYRIHGSNEPWTIGQAVSSGCIRMRNDDVIDLYERVKLGAKVVVI